MESRMYRPVFPLGRHRSISSPGPMNDAILSLYQNVELPTTPDTFRHSAPTSPLLFPPEPTPPIRRISVSYPVIPSAPRPPRVIREAVLHSKSLVEEKKPAPRSPAPKMQYYASNTTKPRPRVEDLPLPPEEWLTESSSSSSGSSERGSSVCSGLESRHETDSDPVTHNTVMQLHAQFLTVSLKTLLKMSA